MSFIALATSARALVDDFNARDWSGVIARCGYQVCFKDMATSNATSDIQKSVDSLQQWVSSFPDLRATLISHHFAEKVDIGELLFEGHQQGGFIVEDGKIPATGRKVSWAACIVIEKRQEKISDIRLYYDLGTILDQLATPIPSLPTHSRKRFGEDSDTIDSRLKEIQSRWAADGFNFVEWRDPPGKNWPPIIHPVDEVVYLIQGTLVFVVDGEYIRVEPGQEIFVPAGATHTVHNNSDSMNHWCYGYRLNSNDTASLRKR